VTLPQLDWKLASIRWASLIEPFLNKPANQAVILPDITLTTGVNVINHRLGDKLRGWFPTRVRGVSATFYDQQDTNPTPALTLILVSSADVTIDLAVF